MAITPQRFTQPALLKDKRLAIVGFGARTGVSLAAFLLKHESRLWLYDKQPGDAVSIQENLNNLKAGNDYRQSPTASQLQLQFGTDDFSWLQEVELVITSPGVPLSEPIFKAATTYGKPVISEIEFASWFLTAPIIAVTGTNGKTTTTALLGQLFVQHGDQAFLGGNYGNPLINAVGQHWDYIVAEVSSFQLETTFSFHPHIAVLTNITEDHLDRHATVADYARIKGMIFANQRGNHHSALQQADWAVINGDDPLVLQTVAPYPVRKLGFTMFGDSKFSVQRRGKEVHLDLTYAGGGKAIISLERCPLLGEHNIQNVMAMLSVGALLGIDISTLQRAVDQAKAPRHRLEHAGTHAGVIYINDSKGTTVDSTLYALKSFTQPIVLILGGKDKGADYRLLKKGITGKIKAIVAYGESGPRLQREIPFNGPLVVTQAFADAVARAQEMATAGDVVLLSPATASLDQFKSYEERGDRFCELVAKMGSATK